MNTYELMFINHRIKYKGFEALATAASEYKVIKLFFAVFLYYVSTEVISGIMKKSQEQI